MSNEVSKATENFFQKYGRAATSQSIIGRLLKFTKFGEYCAGQEEELIPYGTRMGAYMDSLSVGYQRWDEDGSGGPAETIMGPIAQGFVPPKRETLGYLDKSAWQSFDDGRPKDPWQFTNKIVLANIATKELFTFSTSSKGGLSAIGQLCLKHGEHIRQKPEEGPILELQMGSYRHSNRNYGEIRFPIFKVVGQISTKSLPPIDGANEQQQLEAPDDGGGDGDGDGGDGELSM